jgi:hypothetical protein
MHLLSHARKFLRACDKRCALLILVSRGPAHQEVERRISLVADPDGEFVELRFPPLPARPPLLRLGDLVEETDHLMDVWRDHVQSDRPLLTVDHERGCADEVATPTVTLSELDAADVWGFVRRANRDALSHDFRVPRHCPRGSDGDALIRTTRREPRTRRVLSKRWNARRGG